MSRSPSRSHASAPTATAAGKAKRPEAMERWSMVDVLETGRGRPARAPGQRSAPMSLRKYFLVNCIFCASEKDFRKASALSFP